MAEDIVKSSEQFSENLKDSEEYAKGIEASLKAASDYMSKFMGGGGTGGGVANPMGGQPVNSSSGFGRGSFQTMGGNNVNVGSDGFARGVNATPGDYKRDFNNLLPLANGLTGAALGVAKAALMAMPDPNEAIYSELTSSRLKFYAGTNTKSAEGNKLRFAKLGTATDALDAAYASNLGADVGLLPGLSNYYTNQNANQGARYGGIMGGAALASNLTPGLGLQGGMALMGSLNQARRVNMLRMIGVNVRGIGGTNMRDLPAIIGRIYELLKNANGGENPTRQEIAVSAMSGNALDSLLNQYFGDDENLRQVVIAGLMQLVNTGGTDLNISGTQKGLVKTGGMTTTASSLGVRSSRELDLIQHYDQFTTEGIRGANDVLYNLYGNLMSAGKNLGFVRGASTAMGFAETFGGARNGAGAILATEVIGSIGGAVGEVTQLKNAGGIAKLLTTIGAAAATLLGLEGLDKMDIGNTYTYDLPKFTGNPKGALTLNVFSRSSDPTQVAYSANNAITYASTIATGINTATLANAQRRS